MSTCGECRECCIHLHINEPGWKKAAGDPCHHLAANGCGCSIYGKPEWPTLCRGYLCMWRSEEWMSSRPNYRPDKLGVIIDWYPWAVTVRETRPGAAEQASVQYIIARYRRQGQLVKIYPHLVSQGVLPQGEPDGTGQSEMPEDFLWEEAQPGTYKLKRVALPMV